MPFSAAAPVHVCLSPLKKTEASQGTGTLEPCTHGCSGMGEGEVAHPAGDARAGILLHQLMASDAFPRSFDPLYETSSSQARPINPNAGKITLPSSLRPQNCTR